MDSTIIYPPVQIPLQSWGYNENMVPIFWYQELMNQRTATDNVGCHSSLTFRPNQQARQIENLRTLQFLMTTEQGHCRKWLILKLSYQSLSRLTNNANSVNFDEMVCTINFMQQHFLFFSYSVVVINIAVFKLAVRMLEEQSF